MPRKSIIALLASLTIAGCNNNQAQRAPANQAIKVRGAEQKQLHELGAFDLAIALKRAIYDAGFTCKRVTDGGFIGTWKNLDMWMAHCEYQTGAPRDWAIFAGPDGSAQVRDCKDIPGSGLPDCVIKERPKGSFTAVGAEPKGSTPAGAHDKNSL
jgi:hypothetical protein